MDDKMLHEIVKAMMHENFAFLIGSGASLKSIASPSELASGWLREIVTRLDKEGDNDKEGDSGKDIRLKLKDCFQNKDKALPEQKGLYEILSKDTCLDIALRSSKYRDDWTKIATCLLTGIANNYFNIATMLSRFGGGQDVIRKSIEDAMDNARQRPGPGHMCLAKIAYGVHKIRRASHNVILTTNFDYLLEEIFIHYKKECSQKLAWPNFITDASTAFYRIGSNGDIAKRPVVFHVHNDFLSFPRNTAREVRDYPEQLKKSIKKLVYDRNILVLGYGGADDGLMDTLFDSNIKTIYWGHFDDNPPSTEGYLNLERSHKHSLKPFKSGDFDEFMVELYKKISPSTPSDGSPDSFADTSASDNLSNKQPVLTNKDNKTEQTSNLVDVQVPHPAFITMAQQLERN